MKNSLIALALVVASTLFAAETKPLAVNASIGYESEYVYRGQNLSHNVLVTSLEGTYHLYNGSAYLGVLNYSGISNNSATFEVFRTGNSTLATASDGYRESDFYVGYKMPIYEKFNLDFGFTYYWYTSNSAFQVVDFRREIYAGLTYNGLYVNPSVYVFYDFDREALTGELSGNYSFDLAKYGVSKTSLDLGAYIGGVSANNANTDQGNDLVGGKWHDGYTYYGATTDLVYSLTPNAKISAGVRYGGNNNNLTGVVDTISRENNLWCGAKVSAGF